MRGVCIEDLDCNLYSDESLLLLTCLNVTMNIFRQMDKTNHDVTQIFAASFALA